jgi:tricorn protease
MLRPLIAVALFAVWPQQTQTPQGSGDARPTFIEPAFSPDGSEIAFGSGGDIWTVPARGGDARLLISNPATDGRPLYSPDGTRLAFFSNRTGNGDIYILSFADGSLRRITFDDTNDFPDGWSRDGKYIYFMSTRGDIAGMSDAWRVSAEGGTPMQVAADRYASEYWSSPAPDGAAVAITARGITSGQWWRKGRSHIDESEIWVVTPGAAGAAPAYRRVSDGNGGAKELWPMWSNDGRSLYYVSDRGGTENLWRRPAAGGAATQLTRFSRGRLLWPQISLDGKAITFERDFGVWTFDVASGEAKAVPIALRGAAAGPAVERLSITNAGGLALAPDARKIAFTMRGEVFAASARDGGNATRVTSTTGLEAQVSWASDSRRIAYASDRDGAWHIYMYDFVTSQERRLTNTAASDVSPVWSPDGKSIIFTRAGKELRILDVAAGTDRVLASGRFEYPPLISESQYRFSPDNKWVAYLTEDERGFSNAFLVPAAGGMPQQVSFGSTTFADCLQFGPDGKYILLCTSQRTESSQLIRVDLVPRAPRFREDLFRELFPGDSRPARPDSGAAAPPAAPPAAAPAPAAAAGTRNPPATEPVFDNIRRRASIIPLNVDVAAAVISPDGKNLVVSASAAGQQQLWAWSLDEDSPTPPSLRQLTTSTGGKQRIAFSSDSREVWYLEAGRVSAINVESRAARTVAVTGEMDVDFAKEKMEVVRQAHSYMRDNFFDEKMNGSDWNAVGETFRRQVAGARTPDEMRRLLSLMVGELNASHLGATGGAPVAPYAGKLGARYDRAEYEATGKLKVTEIIPLGPLTLVTGVAVGDYILSVDGTPVTARTNLDELLSHKLARRVVLSVASTATGAPRDVIVRPISTAAEKALLYRSWVEDRRAYVARVSNGQLGYVHMIDMGDASLNQLYLDLDTENHARKGVVVDLRNNNGGFVNPYAIDVFARRGYLTFQGRGQAETPGRLQVGQRSLERPTILVTNQHSLSDAEDFTEGYRTLKLGKVVGEPTAGWIIFTWNVGLIDGTTLRLPRQRIRGADGKDMELVPRPVDVTVTRPIGEWYSGRDSQLDEAVKQLLAQIGR